MLKLYPELNAIPQRFHSAALWAARGQVWRSWQVVMLACVYVGVFIGWVVSRKSGFAWEEALAASSILVIVLWTMLFRSRMRSELSHSTWRSQSA